MFLAERTVLRISTDSMTRSLFLFFLFFSCIKAFYLFPEHGLIKKETFSKFGQRIHIRIPGSVSFAKSPSLDSLTKIGESKVKSPHVVSSLNTYDTFERSDSFAKGVDFPTSLNGSDIRVGIIMTRWNSDVIQRLHQVCVLPLLANV